MTGRRLKHVLVLALASSMMALGPGGGSQAVPVAAKSGKLALTVRAPRGVAVTLRVSGKPKQVLATTGATKTRKVLTVSAGKHTINAPRVVDGGRVYVASPATTTVSVHAGSTTGLTVTYQLLAAAPRDLHLSALGTDSIGLAWSNPSGVPVALRRTTGTAPAASVSAGTAVPVIGTTATDSGLMSGQSYSYALFGKVKGAWVGPLVQEVATLGAPGAEATSFLAADETVLPPVSKVISAVRHPGGITARLTGTPPTIGSHVVIPAVATLPTGYVGKVVAVKADGSIELVQASLGDAFDYLKISVPHFSSGPLSATPVARSARRSAKTGTTSPCEQSLGTTLSFDPTFDLYGSLSAEILKKEIRFFPDIPVGAHLKGDLGVRLGGEASLSLDVALACSQSYTAVEYNFSVGPVPMTFKFEPTVEVTAGGALTVGHLGIQATAGMWFDTQFGFDVDNFADGGVTADAQPLTPEVTGEASLEFALKGEATLGPGGGVEEAGAVVGIKGTLSPLVASLAISTFREEVGSPPAKCVVLDAGIEANLAIEASAWLGEVKVSHTVDIPGTHAEASYPGFPRQFPDGCTDSPNTILVVDVGSSHDNAQAVTSALYGVGFQADYTELAFMPARLDEYHQIWVIGDQLTDYPDSLMDTLKAFIRDGGSVYLGADPTADAASADVQALQHDVALDWIGPIDVSSGCLGSCAQSTNQLTPDVAYNFAQVPNNGISLTTVGLGSYSPDVLGVSILSVDGQIGAIAMDRYGTAGAGALVSVADFDWSRTGLVDDYNRPFIENLAWYLRNPPRS